MTVDPSVRRCESGCLSADDKTGLTDFVTGAEGQALSASLNFCRGWLVRWKGAGMVLMAMTNTTGSVAASASIGCTLSGM